MGLGVRAGLLDTVGDHGLGEVARMRHKPPEQTSLWVQLGRCDETYFHGCHAQTIMLGWGTTLGQSGFERRW